MIIEEIKHPVYKTISAVECACGCGNLLSMKTVERGWKVIRGHRAKLNGVVHSKPLAPVQHTPRQKPGTSVNMDNINTFIAAQLDLTQKELKEAETEADRIRYNITALRSKIEKLQKAKAAVKEI